MPLIDSQAIALEEAQKVSGLTPKFARDLVRKFRAHLTNGQTLNQEQFLAVMDDVLGKATKKETINHRQALFALFDTNHSGEIDVHEFCTVFQFLIGRESSSLACKEASLTKPDCCSKHSTGITVAF